MLQFDREPDPKWFLLRGPHRLVIDLPQTAFVVEPKALKARGLISNVRYGALNEGASRLILTAKGPFAVDKVDVIANEDGQGLPAGRRYLRIVGPQVRPGAGRSGADHRLDRLDAEGRPRRQAGRSIRASASPWSSTPAMAASTAAPKAATARSRRTITLAFARELRDKLAKTGKYDVYMTRDTDEFLRLDERVRIARQHEADLFISIHADTINRKGIRGATVYTVSDKASDAEAQALADRENLSDTLGRHRRQGRESRGRRHPGRPHPPRDAHLFGALCPLAGRRVVADRRR